jgi:hypothetical protein
MRTDCETRRRRLRAIIPGKRPVAPARDLFRGSSTA